MAIEPFTGSFPRPQDYPTSERFRSVFSKNYLEPLGIKWVKDADGDNTPDAREIEIAQESFDKYKVADRTVRKFTQEISDAVNSAFMAYVKYYGETINDIDGKYELIQKVPSSELAKLSTVGRLFVQRAAAELGPLVNELYLRQQNPRAIASLKQLRHDAVTVNMPEGVWTLVSHTMSDDCPAPWITDEKCSLYPIPPDKPAISGMMPWDMTPLDWELISTAYNKAERSKDPILMPDTVIEWKGGKRPASLLDGIAEVEKKREEKEKQLAEVDCPIAKAALTAEIEKLKQEKEKLSQELLEKSLPKLLDAVRAVPIPRHSRFSDVSRRIAAKAKGLANFSAVIGGRRVKLSDEYPQIAAHLKAVARFFTKGDAESAAEVIRTIVNQNGDGSLNLRFAVSPGTESYWADNTKFAALMWIGVIDENAQRQVEPQLPTLVSDSDKVLTSRTAYKGEGDKGVNRADLMDMVYYGGFLRGFPHATPAGWNIPNYPYPNVDNKYIASTNILSVRLFRNKPLNNFLLGAPSAELLTAGAAATFIVVHEIGHRTGPSRQYVTGTGAPLSAAFKGQWGWADEPKADGNTMAYIKRQLESDKITLEEARQNFTTSIQAQLTRMPATKELDKIGQDHAIGTVISMGFWYEKGLYRVENGADGQPRIVWSRDFSKLTKDELLKFLSYGEELYCKYADLEAKGDREAFLKFGNDMASKLPDGVVKWVQRGKTENQFKMPFIVFTIPPAL